MSEAARAGSLRLFVALMLGEELGRSVMRDVELALGCAADARGSVRPRPEDLHATLYFFGDVGRERVEPLWNSLAGALEGAPAPRLLLDRAGAFPSRGHERVLWIGLREEPEFEGRFEALWERTLAAVEPLGWSAAPERQRGFHPHVTVARPRAARTPESFYALRFELPWRPTAVALVESTRDAAGAIYRPIRTRKLAAG